VLPSLFLFWHKRKTTEQKTDILKEFLANLRFIPLNGSGEVPQLLHTISSQVGVYFPVKEEKSVSNYSIICSLEPIDHFLKRTWTSNYTDSFDTPSQKIAHFPFYLD